jgi:hypothetical protein
MKLPRRCQTLLLKPLLSFLIAAIPWLPAQAFETGLLRTQEIPLKAGWNAVFLEVEPVENTPEKVFAGLPVDKVATIFGGPTANQFVTDPGVDLFKGRGWGVWYASNLPEAFLKSLDAIYSNRAYLIHAKSDFVWKPSGAVRMRETLWTPDSFNFTGCSVRTLGAPTFAEFFAGSTSHAGQAIYRLVDGRWKKVLQPSAQTMRSGEAFWIFCKGGSEFQGPLNVELDDRRGISLAKNSARLIVRNACAHPLTPRLEHIAGSGPAVPLSILVRAIGDPTDPIKQIGARKPAGAWEQNLPPLEALSALSVPFECRSNEMIDTSQGSILKITTDIGTETWIPVMGFRDDYER